MVNGLRIEQTVSENETKILTYRDILSMAVCEGANTACYLQVFGLTVSPAPKFKLSGILLMIVLMLGYKTI